MHSPETPDACCARLDHLSQMLSIITGSDNLESDASLDTVIRFRNEHMRVMRLITNIESAVTWIIRGVIGVLFAMAVWVTANVATIVSVVEKAHHQ